MSNVLHIKSEVWPAAYSRTAISFVLLLILVLYSFFPYYVMPLPILFFGFSIIVFFFFALNQYSIKWANLSTRVLQKKLFWHSLGYRLIFVGLMYLLTLWLDPQNLPFEIDAVDSKSYHFQGIEIAKEIWRGDVTRSLSRLTKSQADYGFPLYVGIVYFLFGPYTLAVQLLNALWGSLTVVYIYRITAALYDESNARFTGILAMLMPPLLWFGAMSLKETLLIFIIILIIFNAIKVVQRRQLPVFSVATMIFLISILFYFRLFLPVLIMVCIVLYFLLHFSRRRSKKFLLLFSTLIVGIGMFKFIILSGSDRDIQKLFVASSTQFEMETNVAAKQTGISYNKSLVAPLMFMGALVTPFPSFLDFHQSQLPIYVHFFNQIIRNILYYFALVGIYFSLKSRFRDTSIITLFGLGYIAVLAIAGVAYQTRFQLLSLPIMIIFMSEGFKHHRSFKIRWTVYLFFMAIAIFSWNIFKLSNRGLI